MFRSRSWFGGGFFKPKNPHSLEHLKYLYSVLSKNQTVSEGNRGLLVETLRSIAEILIWGDQNDGSVFDFFLEKNMLSFFLKIMKQKCGSYVCVQLLQTLNILFENIRNETSLYYLLSNNHVNSIIVHKFDFSDEEVMAYYISFLKTLSLKLNTHTIHFFYNEHTNDFPLYTEAIKFFNHPESMVRIAVRTLTLNVYRVDDKSMLKFIRDKTAAPYFSNLVWFIGNHVLELDACIRNDADTQSRTKLADLVAEHLDHLHYLNDILCLEISDLNEVLTDHLLNRLLIPLYVYSLTKRRRHSQLEDDKPHVSSVVSLFLLSQVFLIITHVPLVQALAWIILNGDMGIFSEGGAEKLAAYKKGLGSKPGFIAPAESLEKSLQVGVGTGLLEFARTPVGHRNSLPDLPRLDTVDAVDGEVDMERPLVSEEIVSEECADPTTMASVTEESITDEEKEQRLATEMGATVAEVLQDQFSLSTRPFLEAIFNALECSENDYAALFGLCLLYAVGHNPGIQQEILDAALMPTDRSENKHCYNKQLVEELITIITTSCHYASKVRLVTLEMASLLLKQLVFKNGCSYLQDSHLAAIEGAREESILLLRSFYKSEEIFLDMFEDEYNEMRKRPLNVECLMMDSSVLLPPAGTPLTGVEFNKRLPCGEVERAHRAIRVFFLIRDLSLTLRMDPEKQLPLTNPQACIQVNDVLDLNNSDLLACTVISKDGQKIKRFLVIDVIQLILVEPDTKRVGWGVAKFVGFLQDIEVTGDKDDSRCLHVTIHRSPSGTSGRALRSGSRELSNSETQNSPQHRPLFTVNKVPGFATAVRKDWRNHEREGSTDSNCSGKPADLLERRASRPQSSGSSTGSPKSREGSPRLPRPRSEEIPLEDMSIAPNQSDTVPVNNNTAVKAKKSPYARRRCSDEERLPSSRSSSRNRRPSEVILASDERITDRKLFRPISSDLANTTPPPTQLPPTISQNENANNEEPIQATPKDMNETSFMTVAQQADQDALREEQGLMVKKVKRKGAVETV